MALPTSAPGARCPMRSTCSATWASLGRPWPGRACSWAQAARGWRPPCAGWPRCSSRAWPARPSARPSTTGRPTMPRWPATGWACPWPSRACWGWRCIRASPTAWPCVRPWPCWSRPWRRCWCGCTAAICCPGRWCRAAACWPFWAWPAWHRAMARWRCGWARLSPGMARPKCWSGLTRRSSRPRQAWSRATASSTCWPPPPRGH